MATDIGQEGRESLDILGLNVVLGLSCCFEFFIAFPVVCFLDLLPVCECPVIYISICLSLCLSVLSCLCEFADFFSLLCLFFICFALACLCSPITISKTGCAMFLSSTVSACVLQFGNSPHANPLRDRASPVLFCFSFHFSLQPFTYRHHRGWHGL